MVRRIGSVSLLFAFLVTVIKLKTVTARTDKDNATKAIGSCARRQASPRIANDSIENQVLPTFEQRMESIVQPTPPDPHGQAGEPTIMAFRRPPDRPASVGGFRMLAPADPDALPIVLKLPNLAEQQAVASPSPVSKNSYTAGQSAAAATSIVSPAEPVARQVAIASEPEESPHDASPPSASTAPVRNWFGMALWAASGVLAVVTVVLILVGKPNSSPTSDEAPPWQPTSTPGGNGGYPSQFRATGSDAAGYGQPGAAVPVAEGPDGSRWQLWSTQTGQPLSLRRKRTDGFAERSGDQRRRWAGRRRAYSGEPGYAAPGATPAGPAGANPGYGNPGYGNPGYGNPNPGNPANGYPPAGPPGRLARQVFSPARAVINPARPLPAELVAATVRTSRPAAWRSHGSVVAGRAGCARRARARPDQKAGTAQRQHCAALRLGHAVWWPSKTRWHSGSGNEAYRCPNSIRPLSRLMPRVARRGLVRPARP